MVKLYRKGVGIERNAYTPSQVLDSYTEKKIKIKDSKQQETKTQNSKTQKLKTQKLKTQNSKTQNPKLKTQNPKLKTQNSKTQKLKNKATDNIHPFCLSKKGRQSAPIFERVNTLGAL